jgi:aspartate aminotransferase
MEYPVCSKVASLTPSVTLAISAKAKELKSQGLDVIGFGAGEPDFDTPKHIKDAAVTALNNGFTKYTPSSGTPELKQAIIRKFQRDQGLDYDPKQIIVSCGGKHSCFNVIFSVCNPGDEVIIPSPYWLSYPEMAVLADAKPVTIPASDGNGFKVTPDQLKAAITDKTRIFILNSPGNPTGAVYTPGEIRALADICLEKNVLIMSDDIYEKLLYDGVSHTCPAAFSPEHKAITIIVHGLAKAYSMTGWRIGFTAAPLPIAKAMDALQSHSTSNPTSFAQSGAVAALDGPQDHLDGWMAEFDKRRLRALELLNNMKGISCFRSQGAFYLFPKISDTGMKSQEFCEKLLEKARVAAVPGAAFGSDDHIRISYATSLANIEKGLERMADFVSSLT